MALWALCCKHAAWLLLVLRGGHLLLLLLLLLLWGAATPAPAWPDDQCGRAAESRDTTPARQHCTAGGKREMSHNMDARWW